MQCENLKSEKGFSFLELLVSMTVLGALSGISMSVFSAYQSDAYNALALTHLKNIVAGEEAFYSSADTYLECENEDCLASLRGVTNTPGVKVHVLADEERFTIASCNSKGNLMYLFDSNTSSLSTEHIVPGACEPIAPDLY